MTDPDVNITVRAECQDTCGAAHQVNAPDGCGGLPVVRAGVIASQPERQVGCWMIVGDTVGGMNDGGMAGKPAMCHVKIGGQNIKQVPAGR